MAAFVCAVFLSGAAAAIILAIPNYPLPKENRIPEAAKAVLENADRFELFSLDPVYRERPPKNAFHGYEVLGKADISDTPTRRKLVSAFERGVAENQGLMAACFNPRHGIWVTRGDKTVDFVICFACDQVHVGGDVHGFFLVTGSPQPVFDQVLRDAKVPLAPKRRP